MTTPETVCRPLDDYYAPTGRLLPALGSFWAKLYEGRDQVAALLAARAFTEAELHQRLAELWACLSRQTTPVWHVRNWYYWRLRASDRQTSPVRFGDADVWFDGTVAFGATRPESTPVAWRLPDGLVDPPVVTNRVGGAGLVWVRGLDFRVAGDLIVFRDDPFTRPEFAQDFDGEPVCGLWVYRGRWDERLVARQYGYAIGGGHWPSTPAARQMTNAVYDGLTAGGIETALADAACAACGVPVARYRETVQVVRPQDDAVVIITDRSAYRLVPHATVRVQVGQTLRPGQALGGGLRLLRMSDPGARDELTAISLGPRRLAAGFTREIVFPDLTVPVTVSTTPAGRTTVRWPLPGEPEAVAAFFAAAHPGEGPTLAQWLDRRPQSARQQTPEPPPGAIPEFVNPLEIALSWWRTHGFLVVCRPQEFGPGALGLDALAVALRQIVPPHVLVVVVIELFGPAETFSMTTPGWAEATAAFAAGRTGDSLVAGTHVTEHVKVRRYGGGCG